MSNSRKKPISMFVILLMPIGIAINFVGAQIAHALKLPVYLDVIGTILVGSICGPLFGGITGLLTNVVTSITAPTELPYALVSMAAGIVAGLLGKKNMFKTVKGTIISGIAIWAIVLITVTPITTLVYGGGTGVTGGSAITAFLMATGRGLWASVFSSVLLTETLDKFISVFVVYFILKSMPKRTILKFPLGKTYLGSEAQEVQTNEEW